MKITDIIGMCFKNLWRRKVRTLLTVLGVVIGSCAIIVMISLGLGTNAALKESLSQMGDLNVITVYGYGYSYTDENGNTVTKKALDQDGAAAISQVPKVSATLPLMEVNSNIVSMAAGRGDRYKGSWLQLYGVYPENLEAFGYVLEQGAIPTDGSSNFLLFGAEAAYQFRDSKKRTNNYVWAETLPDGTIRPPFFDPMTENITVSVNNTKKPNEDGTYQSGGRAYEHKLPVAGIFAKDYNHYESVYGVFMDMNLATKLNDDYNKLNGIKNPDPARITTMYVRVDDINDIADVQSQIESMGYECYSMESIRKQMQGQVMQMQMLLGGLAAISLFVAAIGITNTMIMSIYERTREIGVMKVLGCFISNIRQLFLLESGCIGLLGGVLGTLISYLISFLLNTFGSTALGLQNMYMGGETSAPISIIPIWLVLLAIAFSTGIGLLSGFYPANRAVKISALEAIKNE